MQEAAKILGVDADTLRRRIRGREWLEINGQRIRIFRTDIKADAERRFDADEIRRALAMKQAR
jgi:hypothetical protein